MFRLISIILFILLVGINNLSSQNMTTSGTDFWLSFMNNTDESQGPDMLKVFVAGNSTCSVTLSNPNTGWHSIETVYPGQVSIISVPQNQGYTSGFEQLSNTGLHLTSPQPVSVYTATMGAYSYDITNIYPTEVLRDRYMIQSYPSDRYGSEFVVVATENNTWVDIILTSATVGGFQSGDTVSIFLPVAGKCYQMISVYNGGDFSGTTVTARDCKRIAVFQGDVCAYIPDRPTGGSCDHIVEQAVPTDYWGRKFLVAPSTESLHDRVRITALYDSCEVLINGGTNVMLMSGGTYEYTMTGPVAQRNPMLINASSPVSVNQYFASTGSGIGDPSMITIFPVEQMIDSVTFISRSSTYTNNHYVNIVLKTEDCPLLRCDGSLINQDWFTPFQYDPSYSYVRMLLGTTTQSHTINMAGGSGFNAYSYGLGNHESYGFCVGVTMKDISQQLVVNNRTMFNGEDYDVCVGKNLRMYVNSTRTDNNFLWVMGDGNYSISDTVNYAYTAPGQYQVTVMTQSSYQSCFPVFDTFSIFVNVYNPDTVDSHHLQCEEDGAYVWYGDSLTEAGVYYHLSPTNNEKCDTIRRLFLTIGHADTLMKNINACDSAVIDGQVYYFSTLLPPEHYFNQDGCDSVINTQLTINRSVMVDVDVTISQGETFTWIDGREYGEPTDSAWVMFTTVNGCDSIVRLNLIVVDSVNRSSFIDSSVIWVPNCFTPELETNKLFFISSVDIISMEVYIYTRQGNLVTHFDGLTESWDGKLDGKPCKSESYVYLIKYVTKAMPQIKHNKTGTVLLLR